MPGETILGILFGLLAGTMNALGAVLQKAAVNRYVDGKRGGGFVANVVRDPLWLAGFVVGHFIGSIFVLFAQNYIGPALMPALIASGLVVLAVASARLLHEDLKLSEWLGVGLLVAGIALVGLSNLEISRSQVDILDGGLQLRAGIFSGAFALFWGLSFLTTLRLRGTTRGILQAVSSGAPYCLSNLWILPLLITSTMVFAGKALAVDFIILVLSFLILALALTLGLWQTQEAFRYAPANKVLPIQQVPQQIAPLLIFVFVYQRSLAGVELALALMGISLVLVGGFLLGNRQAGMETGQPESAHAAEPGESK